MRGPCGSSPESFAPNSLQSPGRDSVHRYHDQVGVQAVRTCQYPALVPMCLEVSLASGADHVHRDDESLSRSWAGPPSTAEEK
jgi:hypothetical protein